MIKGLSLRPNRRKKGFYLDERVANVVVDRLGRRLEIVCAVEREFLGRCRQIAGITQTYDTFINFYNILLDERKDKND